MKIEKEIKEKQLLEYILELNRKNMVSSRSSSKENRVAFRFQKLETSSTMVDFKF